MYHIYFLKSVTWEEMSLNMKKAVAMSVWGRNKKLQMKNAQAGVKSNILQWL